MKNATRFQRVLAAVSAASLMCGVLTSVLALPAPASAQTKDPAATTPKRVIVVFKNGNKVEGELVSETDTTIKLRVVVAGIKGESDYNRSDILEIKSLDAPKTDSPKDAPKGEPAAKPDAKPAAKPDGKPAPKADAPAAGGEQPAGGDVSGLVDEAGINFGDQSWRVTTRASASEPNGPKVYILNMGGEFGRDVSFTPMKEVLRDIKKYQPDVLVCFYNHEFARYGREKGETDIDLGAFDQLEQAREIATLLIDEIRRDDGFTTKPRLVSWIRKAMGGAAFLPFVAKEMYYTPDALHGGIGYLEHIFDGRGDERAREKQYSLRQARGEGLAEMGGHEKLIMRAMARTDFVLSYKIENGKPVFLANQYPESSDEVLLTDDGKDKNADAMQDYVRGIGNDTLTLRADVAYRLGLSNGTAETLDDLMDRMGLPRNYVVVRGRGNQILREWSKQVSDAESQFSRLFRQYNDVRVKPPGDYAARTKYRGERKQLLLKVKNLLEKYKEAINPYRIQGGPEEWTTQIDSIIQVIDAQQLADKPERR